MTSKQHWNAAYEEGGPTDVSWYQSRPETSLQLIREAVPSLDLGIIDVGGGASTLVDCLLEAGYSSVAVLDISGSALGFARDRLGSRSAAVQWLEEDVIAFNPPRQYHLWHDRAVFHFLTTGPERDSYLASLCRSLIPGGHVVIATFATDGPEKCSGLPVQRYDEAAIAAELGKDFELLSSVAELHVTPWVSKQSFTYFCFKYSPSKA